MCKVPILVLSRQYFGFCLERLRCEKGGQDARFPFLVSNREPPERNTLTPLRIKVVSLLNAFRKKKNKLNRKQVTAHIISSLKLFCSVRLVDSTELRQNSPFVPTTASCRLSLLPPANMYRPSFPSLAKSTVDHGFLLLISVIQTDA